METTKAIALSALCLFLLIITGFQYRSLLDRIFFRGLLGSLAQGVVAESGDGKDLLPDGKPAPTIPAGTIPSSAPCGLAWISDNPLGLAPNPPPSIIRFKRIFNLSEKDLEKGQFILTFKADDKAEFFLNGKPKAAAACAPPPGNDGECQQFCHVFIIPASAFHPGPNELDILLTNLFNISVGNQFGWTELSYRLRHTE
ncbi:MAG TPA: hypothetical protein VMV05_09635 [bacterium]|nr:hypothetical protein [bacterium]